VDEEGLSDEHFDAVAELLSDTLIEMGVDDGLRNEVLEIVGSTRDEVLCR
jgi:truncated hemoglobin YjbI